MSLLSALLFPVPPPSYDMHSFPNELLWIPFGLDYHAGKTGGCVPAVFLQSPNARYLVLYLHTNGEDLGSCYPFASGLRMLLEVHVLAVEYPGYGLFHGESSEETLWEAVDTAFRFVQEVLHWPPEDVIVMGRSLGAALATRLACKHVCHGLLLVAPFLSLAEVVGQFIGKGLARALVGGMFGNRELMSGVKVPTMVIHGKEDRLIPWTQGRELLELCPHERTAFVCPEGMGHNSDLLSSSAFLVRPMLSFFSLPDYNFEELRVPPEAFDKRLCLQYHNLVELTKGDAPMDRLLGDQEPCPIHWQSECFNGPQSQLDLFEGSGGDVDDLSGSMDFSVQSHYGGRGGAVRLEAAAGEAAGLGGPAADALETASTEATSSAARASESLSAEGPIREDSLIPAPPGLNFLDIDGGISRFLREDSARLARDPL